MKIIFFGTPDFAVPFLVSLYNDSDIEIQAVVTQPDKPAGRKKILSPPPVKELAEQYNIPVLQPEFIKNNKDFIKLIEGLKPDFIVVIAYGLILPEEILDIPKYGCINVHASLLPKYRGASPIQTALLNGDNETGLSIIEMNKEMDSGDLYYVRKVPINPEENKETLSHKLSEIGSIILPSTLKDIKDGILTPIQQNENEASYCKKIKKKDAQINPVKEAAGDIYNKLRAFTPWPGIFMTYKNKKLKILNANVCDEKIKAGEIKNIKDRLFLGTKKKALKLLTVQLEGKNPMSAKDFINGFLKS